MKKTFLLVSFFLSVAATVFSQEGSLVGMYAAKLVSDSLRLVHPRPPQQATLPAGSIDVRELLLQGTPQKKVLCQSRLQKPVDLYYFPGLSSKKALVIGGIHGSELSSIDVANALIRKLSAGEKPYYSVVVIPCLFPDNADDAGNGGKNRVLNNTGRYSVKGIADPNRQMPLMGVPFRPAKPFDVFHRVIEGENRALLQFLQAFMPDRVVGIHAIRDPEKAGVFADPRTDCNGRSLGFDSDKQLALLMAGYIQSSGGYCPGNKLDADPTALYYLDPPIVPEGQKQPRSFQFPMLQGKNRGVTLGTWCSTAVCAPDLSLNRPAIRTLTIEFPGYKTPLEFVQKEEQDARAQLIEIYAASIHYYFLYSYFVEE